MILMHLKFKYSTRKNNTPPHTSIFIQPENNNYLCTADFESARLIRAVLNFSEFLLSYWTLKMTPLCLGNRGVIHFQKSKNSLISKAPGIRYISLVNFC